MTRQLVMNGVKVVVDRMQILLSDEDIADFEVLRDCAMATICGFLYMGCTLARPDQYD